jgi:hypothetical protein
MNSEPSTPPGAGGRRSKAVRCAEIGTASWEAAARAQQAATPDHSDSYALGGELDATLRAMQDLARVLAEQVAGYGEGRPVYDDTRTVDPRGRLHAAAAELAELARLLGAAQRPAAAYWSAIGHVGVEVTP